jgi:hypothetical protein
LWRCRILSDSATFLSSDRFPAIQLEPIMALYASYHLPKAVSSAMQMIRQISIMTMKYDDGPLLRILRIVQIPIMPGASAHDRYIVFINRYDTEILRIQRL